jgi:uncharacterized RDD family membrane protein YckC
MLDARDTARIPQRFVAALIDGALTLVWIVIGLRLALTDGGSALARTLYAFSWTLANEGALVALTGGTVGKHIMGIRIVRVDGSPLGFGRAIGRWFGKVPSSVLLLGYLMALSDQRRRTLHDRIAGTLVVPKARAQRATAEPDSVVWRERVFAVAVVGIVVGAATGLIVSAIAPIEPGIPLAQHVLRLALGSGLQGMAIGLALANTRMAALGFVSGAAAGAVAIVLFRSLIAVLPDGVRGLGLQVFLLPDIAIGASVGLALSSSRLRVAGAALGCWAYLRIPLVVLLVRPFYDQENLRPGPLYWPAYYAIDTALLALVVAVGFSLMQRRASAPTTSPASDIQVAYAPPPPRIEAFTIGADAVMRKTTVDAILERENARREHEQGVAKMDAGDMDGAIALFRSALAKTADNPEPESYLNIAVCHAHLGQFTQSLAVLEQGMRRFPGNERLRRNYEMIKADAG